MAESYRPREAVPTSLHLILAIGFALDVNELVGFATRAASRPWRLAKLPDVDALASSKLASGTAQS